MDKETRWVKYNHMRMLADAGEESRHVNKVENTRNISSFLNADLFLVFSILFTCLLSTPANIYQYHLECVELEISRGTWRLAPPDVHS